MIISYLCLLHVFMLAFHACDVIYSNDFVHNMSMRKTNFFVTPYILLCIAKLGEQTF